jgi:hypothetical protein
LEVIMTAALRQTSNFLPPLIKRATASSIPLVLAVSLVTPNLATAAPVLTNTASLKAVAANPSIDVRWRGRGGWGPGALAAGIIAGLALGSLASSPYAYASPYGYAQYGYAPGFYGYYGYAPGGRFQDSFRNGY